MDEEIKQRLIEHLESVIRDVKCSNIKEITFDSENLFYDTDMIDVRESRGLKQTITFIKA